MTKFVKKSLNKNKAKAKKRSARKTPVKPINVAPDRLTRETQSETPGEVANIEPMCLCCFSKVRDYKSYFKERRHDSSVEG